MDIKCAKCREPWDAYGVRNGDMEPDEARKFLAGKGCPCCGFGTTCVDCNGTGKERGERFYGTDDCPVCRGSRAVTVRRGLGSLDGGWRYDWDPNTKPVPDSVRIPQEGRRYFDCLGPNGPGTGRAVEARIPCWACKETARPCETCNGSGKFQPRHQDNEEGFAALADVLGDDQDGLDAMLEDLS